jgi:hypothetical protein
MITDIGDTQTGSVSVIFAISVCKTPIRKGDSHRDRKERRGTDDYGSKGPPNRSVLVIFAISVCKTPIRKDDSQRDRKDRKGTDDRGRGADRP